MEHLCVQRALSLVRAVVDGEARDGGIERPMVGSGRAMSWSTTSARPRRGHEGWGLLDGLRPLTAGARAAQDVAERPDRPHPGTRTPPLRASTGLLWDACSLLRLETTRVQGDGRSTVTDRRCRASAPRWLLPAGWRHPTRRSGDAHLPWSGPRQFKIAADASSASRVVLRNLGEWTSGPTCSSSWRHPMPIRASASPIW